MTQSKLEGQIQACVVFFCHDGQGNVFLAKRTVRARNGAGTWDIGGGKIEFGEMRESALLRELEEEYGVTPNQFELMGVREVIGTIYDHTEHWYAFDYLALVDPKRVRICEPEKFSESGWFPIDRLPDPLYQTMADFLAANTLFILQNCGIEPGRIVRNDAAVLAESHYQLLRLLRGRVQRKLLTQYPEIQPWPLLHVEPPESWKIAADHIRAQGFRLTQEGNRRNQFWLLMLPTGEPLFFSTEIEQVRSLHQFLEDFPVLARVHPLSLGEY